MAETSSALDSATASTWEALAASLTLSRHMLEQAKAQQWEELTQTERERDKLLRAAFATTPPHTEAVRLAAVMIEVLGINREILTLTRQAHQQSATQLQELRRGHRARDAYRQHGG